MKGCNCGDGVAVVVCSGCSGEGMGMVRYGGGRNGRVGVMKCGGGCGVCGVGDMGGWVVVDVRSGGQCMGEGMGVIRCSGDRGGGERMGV